MKDRVYKSIYVTLLSIFTWITLVISYAIQTQEIIPKIKKVHPYLFAHRQTKKQTKIHNFLGGGASVLLHAANCF